jgi:nucleoside-diphosphate-sugar epimerase
VIVATGATGGLGRYVLSAIERSGVPHAPLATRLERSEELPLELSSRVTHSDGDVLTLIHLAGETSVERCEQNPEGAYDLNVIASRRFVASFIEWAVAHGRTPSVVYVSSAHVYEAPEQGVRVTETAPLNPRSVYAQTKADAETALAELCSETGASLVIARVFGVVSPDQPSQFLLPSLVRKTLSGRVAGIPGLGNVRDYLDARDVAEHLVDLASSLAGPAMTESSVFNVCSGHGVAIRDILDAVIAVAHGEDSELAARLMSEASAAPGRATDVAWLVGSPEKLTRRNGRIAQSIPLTATIREAVAALR